MITLGREKTEGWKPQNRRRSAKLIMHREGDVFLGISTSGNSQNILNATVVAKALGIKVIALTGRNGGELADVADIAVKVPEDETYKIQELHLPVYHCWCMMLEEHFFGSTEQGK